MALHHHVNHLVYLSNLHQFHYLQLLRHLTPLEKLVAILAAITHDVDHPGVNQAYLIATMNPLASLYNVSVCICRIRDNHRID